MMHNRRNGHALVSKSGRICECSCSCRQEVTVKRIDLCNACQFNRHIAPDGKTFRRPKTP